MPDSNVLFPDFVWRVCRPKILDFGYFVLIWWQTDKKTCKKSWPDAQLQGPVYLDGPTIIV